MSGAPGLGHFRVQGVIEGDGWGPVFRACWQRPGAPDRDTVVQILDPDRLAAEQLARRLADDIPRLARLVAHGGLVVERILSVEGRHAMVRPHVDGVDLATILADQELTPGIALSICAKVGRVLAAAHELPRGGALAHGALDPHRVLVTPAGDVFVTGFGLAVACFDIEGRLPGVAPRAAADAAATELVAAEGVSADARAVPAAGGDVEGEAGVGVGARSSLPPEGLPAGPTIAADVYALGALVLAALDGFLDGPPADSPPAHLRRLDAVLGPLAGRLHGELGLLPDLLAVLLAFDPAERPTAADCADALAALAEHDGGPSLAAWAAAALPALVSARDAAERAAAVERGAADLDLAVDAPRSKTTGSSSTGLHSSLPEVVWDEDELESTWDSVTMPTEPGIELDADRTRPVMLGSDAVPPVRRGPGDTEATAEPPAVTPPPPPPAGSSLSPGVPSVLPFGVPPSASAASSSAHHLPRLLIVIVGLGVLGGAILGVGLVLLLRTPAADPRAGRELSDVRLAPDLEDLVDGVEVDEAPGGATQPPAAQVEDGGGGPVSVGLTGDADAVFLVSDTRRYKLPGPVPGGTWHIEASFGGAAPTRQGALLVAPGDALVIECSAADQRCVVK